MDVYLACRNYYHRGLGSTNLFLHWQAWLLGQSVCDKASRKWRSWLARLCRGRRLAVGAIVGCSGKGCVCGRHVRWMHLFHIDTSQYMPSAIAHGINGTVRQ
jgi:hypothetical protein